MKHIVSVVLLMLVSLTSFAQVKATGKVIFATDKEPVIGAYVKIKGETGGTVTNVEGEFSIEVPKGKKLEFSCIGMKTVVKDPAPRMTILMEDDVKTIEEVVVTGMQVTDKRLFTGASVKLDAENIKLAGASDVSRSLEGRVAGVQVTNVSGTFGAAPKIRVRGATSIYGNSKPLWVIDGVIYEDNVEVSADDLSSGDAKTLISSAVAGLNPDDIETFTILKDGSATSIYGARAMGGVISVTTKKGRKGMVSVNYTGELSIRQKPSYSDYNVMNSQEMMSIYKEMENKGWLKFENLVNAQNTGVYGYMYQKLRNYNTATGSYDIVNTEAARNAYLQQAEMRNTDWFDLLFRNSASQNHSVSVASGSDKLQTYFSMSLLNDPGVYVNRGKVNRYTFNGNATYNILDNLKVKLAAQGSFRKQEAPGSLDRTKDPVSGEVKRDFDISPFSYALSASRCLDPNARYTRFYTDFNIFDELENNYFDINVNDLLYRAELEYKPIKALTLNGLAAVRVSTSKSIQNIMDDSNQANAYRAGTQAGNENSTIRDNNSLLYTDPSDPSALPESVLPKGGIMYQKDDEMRSSNFRLNADYRNVFQDLHTVNFLAGTELSSVRRTNKTWTGWGYQYNNGGVIYTPSIWLKQYNEENNQYFSDTFTQTNNLAFYANGVYNFDQRYTLSGTFRYEGSNRLGKANKSRWLPTWNVSGSWDVMNERFMKRAEDVVSQMKLRLSYSLTADAGPSWVTNSNAIFMTENVWRPTASAQEGLVYIKDLANTELTYEKKHEFNVGLDLGFLNDRICVSVDGYLRDNFDLIGYAYTQGNGGQIRKYANVANMKASGFEFSVSTTNIRNQQFRWGSDFIFSYAKNEITKLNTTANAMELVSGTGYTMQGYPTRSIFSYQFAGLNSEGLPMVINEDGVATVGDVNFQETDNLTSFLKYEGSSDPKWYGSFNNSFSYDFGKAGKLGLDVFITYSGGNVVRLDPVFSSSYSDLSSLPMEFQNRWMKPGDEALTNVPCIASVNQVNKYGSLALKTAYNAYNYSTERIASGDFIRFKELSLTYTMSKDMLRQAPVLKSLSFKLSASNICLLYADKKLNGQDPEVINSGGVSSPLNRLYTMTLRAGF